MAWEKQTLAKIKWRIAVLALLSCGGALSVSTTQAAEPSAVSVNNKMLPASDINWSKYAGKVVVIDFWASWCGPCRESFPWMKQMQAKYGKDGLVFIGINVDKDPALALKFIQQYQPNFEIRSDQQGKLASQFKVPGMPSTFILGRDGQPAAKHQGFFKAKEAEYEAEIVRLLSNKNT